MTVHYISRRKLLALAAGGSALVLAGCGSAGVPLGGRGAGGDDAGGGDVGDPPVAPAPAVSAQTEAVFAADVDGGVFEIDPLGHRVSRLDATGRMLWETPSDELNGPRAVAVDSHGTVCVANHGDSSIVLYDATGTRLGELGGPGSDEGQFNFLPDIAFDADDRLFAVDALNHRIQVLDGTGNAVLVFGSFGFGPGELNGPRALAFDSEGNVHVLDAGNARIQVFDRLGRVLYGYGDHGQGEGEFTTPHDIAIDPWDRVYVTDPGTGRILVFEDAGYRVGAALQPSDDHGNPVVPRRVSVDAEGGLLLNVVLPQVDVPEGAPAAE